MICLVFIKGYKFVVFANFGQVKKIVALLTLGKSKNIAILLTLGESLGWPLIFNLNKTPLGETGCLSNPYFLLTGCSGIQFFDSPLIHPLSQHSQLAYLWLPIPSLCSTCVAYAMPCHWSPSASHPTLT